MLSEPESSISWIRPRYVHVKLRSPDLSGPALQSRTAQWWKRTSPMDHNDEVIGARIVRLAQAHPARLVNDSALLGSGATDSEWWSTP